ncbi:hypothetical protein HYDPIDRAFT_27807 [Hydnomerulius pinastri MD-312]|uniref:Uncharacterized protein n=1 Tax=Hydnomerulius pinastri MD-312 TaxID=994086 RepID=A0A0C9VHF9_9AGAM|nr:hypothetical protein HYDPIDRAFT_27807 [Hydnomerulius pinastri MD-312]
MPGALSDDDTSSVSSKTSQHTARDREDVQTILDNIFIDDDDRKCPTHPEGGTPPVDGVRQPPPSPESGLLPFPYPEPHGHQAAGQLADEPAPDGDVPMLGPTPSMEKQLGADTDVSMSVLTSNSKKRSETDTTRDKVPTTSDKCRYEEVDFSVSLRQELYSKEEVINRLKAKLRQQGRTFQEQQVDIQRRYEGLYNQAMQTARHKFQEQKESVSNMQTLLQQQNGELTSLRNKLEPAARNARGEQFAT